MASTSLAPSILVSHGSSAPQFQVFGIRLMFGYKVFGHRRGFRVRSESTIQEKELRRCSPSLERSSLPKEAALRSNESKVVPDIWRSSVEKYGDKVVVVDPYHDPPSTFTYRQLEQEILDFVEGLRVVRVKADEKIALFTDNSCRWLVADQGIWFII